MMFADSIVLCGESWNEVDNWLLHHEKAPTPIALSIRQFLAEESISVMEESPYSKDLAL